jgi:hypothetical protein
MDGSFHRLGQKLKFKKWSGKNEKEKLFVRLPFLALFTCVGLSI